MHLFLVFLYFLIFFIVLCVRFNNNNNKQHFSKANWPVTTNLEVVNEFNSLFALFIVNYCCG